VGDPGGLREDVGKLWNDVYYGNGKPGIVTRVQSVEDAVDRIEQTLDKFTKNQDRIIWLIVSVVILAVLNLVMKH
jgi:hypothetical protein